MALRGRKRRARKARPQVDNLAELLGESERQRIAVQLAEMFDDDLRSMEGWEHRRTEGFKLAQCKPTRTDREKPWETAANVCVPMVASAVMQFNAREYAAQFEQNYPERCRIIPVEAADTEIAKQLQHFLNWQLINEIDGYEDEWDRALWALPIDGTIFKKQFWNYEEDRPDSVFIPGADCIVPYRIGRLKDAGRISHRLYEKPQEIDRLERLGFYIEGSGENARASGAKADDSTIGSRSKLEDDSAQGVTPPEKHEQVPNVTVEMHFEDAIPELDEKGEPRAYIAWIDPINMKLFRLVHRRHEDRVGRVRSSDHFVDYHFFPNPQGFYGLGFGHYLGPLNKIANTIFNMFIDSGSMSNQPFAVVGRGVGLRSKDWRIKPGGRIEVADATQFQLAKFPGLGQEFPLMLQFLSEFSRDITSTSEEMMGRSPKGVREPTVRGTFARIQQGLTQFGVLHKRIARQLKREYQQILWLDRLNVKERKVFRILGETSNPFAQIDQKLFENIQGQLDVVPTADPAYATPQQLQEETMQGLEIAMRAPLIAGLPQLGIPPNLDAQAVLLKKAFRNLRMPDVAAYIKDPEPPPLDPRHENQQMMEGREVRPTKGEDHMVHIATHLALLNSEAFLATPEDRKAKIRQHIDETMALAQQMALQQAQMAQMAANGQGGTPEPPGSPGPNGMAR